MKRFALASLCILSLTGCWEDYQAPVGYNPSDSTDPFHGVRLETNSEFSEAADYSANDAFVSWNAGIEDLEITVAGLDFGSGIATVFGGVELSVDCAGAVIPTEFIMIPSTNNWFGPKRRVESASVTLTSADTGELLGECWAAGGTPHGVQGRVYAFAQDGASNSDWTWLGRFNYAM